jgi:hypothetical protein
MKRSEKESVRKLLRDLTAALPPPKRTLVKAVDHLFGEVRHEQADTKRRLEEKYKAALRAKESELSAHYQEKASTAVETAIADSNRKVEAAMEQITEMKDKLSSLMSRAIHYRCAVESYMFADADGVTHEQAIGHWIAMGEWCAGDEPGAAYYDPNTGYIYLVLRMADDLVRVIGLPRKQFDKFWKCLFPIKDIAIRIGQLTITNLTHRIPDGVL